jgi:hypothetical protein
VDRSPVKIALAFLFVFIFVHIGAQEKQGIANSNYSPINSAFLNPSSTADNRTYIQINLVGFHTYVHSNLLYLPNFKLWDFSFGAPMRDRSEKNKFLIANGGVLGPSFFISRGNMGAGLFVRARSVVNGKRIPHQMVGVLIGENLPLTDTVIPTVRNAGAANMNWLEYGGNFSWMIRKDRYDMMTLGTNVRYLSGFNGAYAHIQELRGGFEETALRIDAFKGKVRFNDAAFNTGKGFAMDVGFTYKKMLWNIDSYLAHSTRSNCRFIDYKYKLAFSVRDVGYIKFKKNTYTADYNDSGYFYMDPTDLTNRTSSKLDLNKDYEHNPFTMMMPASFSAQFDYNFENNIYINAMLVKNLVTSRVVGVQSPDLLAITPRFEIKNLEVAVPFTLQRFYQPQVGFALRFRTLVLGVDNLAPLIVRKDTYTIGVYFNLGISIFKNPKCKSRTGNVDDCKGGIRRGGNSMRGMFWKRMFKRNKTYSR